MKLRDYLYLNDIKLKDFACRTNIGIMNLSQIKNRKVTPSLLACIKIVLETDGKVQYRDLLSYKDEEKLKEFLND